MFIVNLAIIGTVVVVVQTRNIIIPRFSHRHLHDAAECNGLHYEGVDPGRLGAHKLFDPSLHLLLLWLYLGRLFASDHAESVYYYHLSRFVHSSLLQTQCTYYLLLIPTVIRHIQVIILCLICWLIAPVFMFPLLLEHGGKRAATWNTEQFIWYVLFCSMCSWSYVF